MRTLQSVVLVVSLTLLVAPEAAANRWEQWEWLNPRPQGHTLRDVTASDELYVAIGDQGTILVSGNGLDWETVRTKWHLTLQAVTWTGELFVAVGGYYNGLHSGSDLGEILTSVDGHWWTTVHSVPEVMLMDVHFNGDQLLVVGYQGISLTSTDGITWTEHWQPEEPFRVINDVAWSGTNYVGVGRRYIEYGEWAIFVSENGVDWTEPSLEGLPGMEFTDVVWGHGQFVVFGGVWPGVPYVLTSLDGRSWIEIEQDLVTHVNEAAVTLDGFIAVTWYGGVSKSIELSTWSHEQIVPRSKDLLGIIADSEFAIVVGDEGAIARQPSNGGGWSPVSEWEIESDDSSSIADITTNGTWIVAATTNWKTYRSSDGFAWRETFNTPGNVFSAQWLADAFWAVGGFGLIAESSDGQAWSVRNSEELVDFTDIASDGENLVVVGASQHDGWAALAATSSDGVDWNSIEIEGGKGIRVASVTWTGTQFVGVGILSSVFRSDDGRNWTVDFVEGVSDFYRITSNDEVMVAVADFHDVWKRVGILATSTDGITWHTTRVDEKVRDVIWTGKLFIAIGWGYIYTSTDGIQWSREAVGGALVPTRATVFRDDLIVTGEHGRIMRAQPTTHVHPAWSETAIDE